MNKEPRMFEISILLEIFLLTRLEILFAIISITAILFRR